MLAYVYKKTRKVALRIKNEVANQYRGLVTIRGVSRRAAKSKIKPQNIHLFTHARGGSTLLAEAISSVHQCPVVWEPFSRVENRLMSILTKNFGAGKSMCHAMLVILASTSISKPLHPEGFSILGSSLDNQYRDCITLSLSYTNIALPTFWLLTSFVSSI
jgi:hypothetical protein